MAVVARLVRNQEFIIGLTVLTIVIGLVLYAAWHNYLECRTQFSLFYCATTHLLK